MQHFSAILGSLFFATLTTQSIHTVQAEEGTQQNTLQLMQDKPKGQWPPKGMFKKRNSFKKRLRRRRKTVRGLTFSDYGTGKPNYKSFKNKVNAIKEREIISLDIIIKNNATFFPEGSPCKGTEWGSITTNANTTIHIRPIIGNNHMIFEMLPGSREKFPFTSVSCIYNPTTPKVTYVRFTGFYVVHHHVIPTAVLHEFRSVAKPSYLP